MESSSTSALALDFENLSIDALRAFVKHVADSKETGVEPIILTISRRMPHVLFWFKNTHATENEKRILEETETISEIALPFIDFSKKKNFSVFIIDDVVSSGRTIEYVRVLTEKFSNQPVTEIFVLFCDGYSPFLVENSAKTIIGYKFSTKEEKSKIIDFISTIIALTLPIDVTYPILYFEELVTETQFKEFQIRFRDSDSSEAENYPIKVECRVALSFGNQKIKKGDVCESFTAMLPSVISNSLNNDFAKIRTYRRLDKFIVVPYAPNILTDGDLKDRDLFENEVYRKIWRASLDSIDSSLLKSYSPFDEEADTKEIKRNRSYRSLISVANYLYSLSSFNKLAQEHYTEFTETLGVDICRFSVHKGDLSLILGKKVTDKILSDIKKILENRIISPRLHYKVVAPATFIPKNYEQDYSASRYMSIAVDEKDLRKNLKSLFRNAADKKNKYPSFQKEDIEYDVEGIMESFQSLEKLFIPILTRRI